MSEVNATSTLSVDLADTGFRLLTAGEKVQLTPVVETTRSRHISFVLKTDGEQHSNKGFILHNDIIGKPEGITVANSKGREFIVLRPTIVDGALSLKRGAAIAYPKDSAMIVGYGDIFPGANVLECGAGSGALTMSLLRAVGPAGMLTSVEVRPDFAKIAKANVSEFIGKDSETLTNWNLKDADLADYLQTTPDHQFDRIVLDMLDPWTHIEQLHKVLAPGGVLTCYITTTTQMITLSEALKASGKWTATESFETLLRYWHLDGLSVRPQHQMFGHSGFILTTRALFS